MHKLKQQFRTSPDGLEIISCRLHLHATSSHNGGWSSLKNDQKQWLQVKFGQRVEIRRVSTQGRQALVVTQWVTSYMLNYSSDGLLFYQYRTNKNQTVSSLTHKSVDSVFFQCLHNLCWSQLSDRLLLAQCMIIGSNNKESS